MWETLGVSLSVKEYSAMKFGIAYILPAPRKYLEQIPTHSDYHKFDEMLRMVIDVTRANRENSTFM